MAGGARARPRRCVLVYQASREGLFLRLASALLLTCLAVAPLRAAAQEDPWATFSYVKPAPVYRLRLGLEETGMIAAALTGYLIKAPQPSDPNVPSFSLWEKLRFAPGSWYLDVDELATNFVGHPTAGTFYYMFARSNRVSIPEAFAWTVAASTVWEFLEYKEPVSINDMVVTPVAGLAIGEAFTQLSGWFDWSGTNGLSKALAWIFDPMRKFHDWIDKAQPLRDPAYAGWHEFRAGAAGVLLWQEGQFYPALEVELASRLFRVPGYGQAGRAGFGFIDGNVSAIGLTSTFASGRPVDFLFDTETALLGHYSRDLWTDGEDLHGWDLFVGGTAGFEFGSHVWDIAGSGPKNQNRHGSLPRHRRPHPAVRGRVPGGLLAGPRVRFRWRRAYRRSWPGFPLARPGLPVRLRLPGLLLRHRPSRGASPRGALRTRRIGRVPPLRPVLGTDRTVRPPAGGPGDLAHRHPHERPSVAAVPGARPGSRIRRGRHLPGSPRHGGDVGRQPSGAIALRKLRGGLLKAPVAMASRWLAAMLPMAVVAVAVPVGGRADVSDFFGPSQGLQLQPEVDVIQAFGPSFRIIVKIEPTFVPLQSYEEMGVSLYAAWFVAPLTEPLLSPDLAKRRRLDIRLGAGWYPTLDAGTQGWSNLLMVEGEATVRTMLPGAVLATSRNRVEARWQLDEPSSFTWRLRARLQLEREFDLSGRTTTSLTPFGNVEFIWSTAQDMWSQFRIQIGLQLGVDWFGAGQVIELNSTLITYLQPSRSYAPVIGLVWYQYF